MMIVRRFSLLIPLLVMAGSQAHAAGPDALRARGAALLRQHCSHCHATGPSGTSPMKAAPAMRNVYARFAPKELQAELREGMVSRHRAMPQISFSDEDTDAILAYLYALAVRR